MKTAELLSRSEIIRRHALAGLTPLQQATPDEHERMALRFQATMTATDGRLKDRRDHPQNQKQINFRS